jgi:hypothetical protein
VVHDAQRNPAATARRPDATPIGVAIVRLASSRRDGPQRKQRWRDVLSATLRSGSISRAKSRAIREDLHRAAGPGSDSFQPARGGLSEENQQ